MATIHLTGRITDAGKLEIDLPEGLPSGEVEVTIQIAPTSSSDDWENQPWTEEEIREFLTFEPKSAAEIAESEAFGAWADLGITDSVAWIEELRRKEWERRRASWSGRLNDID